MRAVLQCILLIALALPVTAAVCPSNYDETFDLYAEDICTFPIIIKDFFKNGLPRPAVLAMMKKGMNVGAIADANVLHLSQADICSEIKSSYIVKGKGAAFSQGNPKGSDQFSWKGNFLLFRPAGQKSFDPVIPDMVSSLFVLSGQITFQFANFTVVKYSGAAPIDVCKKVA